MASIYKRGKTWTANVFILQGNTRKRKTKSGFATKSEANKWAVGIEDKKLNNQLKMNDGIFADMFDEWYRICLLYTSPSPRDMRRSRMPSSA